MTPLRLHELYLTAILALLAVGAGLCLHARGLAESRVVEERAIKTLAGELMLTDLSLWTEARYTRHPSQTDFFSPFQDLPGGMEHFPAGALIAPPTHLYKSGKSDASAGSMGR